MAPPRIGPRDLRRYRTVGDLINRLILILSLIHISAQRAVGVPICSVQSEVARHFIGQVRIGFLHPMGGRCEVGIAAGVGPVDVTNLPDLANIFDPTAQPVGRWFVDAMRSGKSEAFDGDHFAHAIGIHAGIEQGEDAAERVPDQMEGTAAEYVHQRCDIQKMFGDAIGRAGRCV